MSWGKGTPRAEGTARGGGGSAGSAAAADAIANVNADSAKDKVNDALKC